MRIFKAPTRRNIIGVFRGAALETLSYIKSPVGYYKYRRMQAYWVDHRITTVRDICEAELLAIL